ncbi:MAG TPA: hypothetical protein VKZ65_16330 [Glycomyces sp.]|nr:hypothetical protein [Glycomyces sp.]
MFVNVSPTRRGRLRLLVAAWALLLVAASLFASGASVREQVDAVEAREDLDAVLGEAAGYLTGGAHVLTAGPLEVSACELTPVRAGVVLIRRLMVEGGEAPLEGLAARLGLQRDPDVAEAVWSGTTADFVGLRLAETGSGVVELRATTGCRPGGDRLGLVRPATPEGGSGSWSFGSLACPGGGRLESWTTPSQERPFTVERTGGGCR